METKRTHYRMYKAGRRWVFACAIVLALGSGAVTAHAATVDAGTDSHVESSLMKSGGTGDDAGEETANQDNDSSTATDKDQNNGANQHTGTDQHTNTETTDNKDDVTGSKLQGGSKRMLALQQPQGRMGALAATDQGTTTPAGSTGTTTTPTATKTSAAVKAALARLAAAAKKTTVTTALTPYAETGIQAGGSVYDDYPDLDNILGVSSVFHIFAREAELNAHTNGERRRSKLDWQR